MMGYPDLDAWFYSLDLKQLMNMFRCPSNREANDFIDDCDETWSDMSIEERYDLYNRFH